MHRFRFELFSQCTMLNNSRKQTLKQAFVGAGRVSTDHIAWVYRNKTKISWTQTKNVAQTKQITLMYLMNKTDHSDNSPNLICCYLSTLQWLKPKAAFGTTFPQSHGIFCNTIWKATQQGIRQHSSTAQSANAVTHHRMDSGNSCLFSIFRPMELKQHWKRIQWETPSLSPNYSPQ